jgi:hypothetical protein
MSKINIAINPSFGKFHVPSTFNSDNTGTQWRIDLAKHLIENSYAVDQVGLLTEEAVKKFWSVQKFTKYKNSYYFVSELNNMPVIAHLDVVEVDTDIPWLINRYDGAESVSELPDFRQVDEFGYHEEV